MNGLTPGEIRAHRNSIEHQVCLILRHVDITFGISLSDWPDADLAERNALVRHLWKDLDRISLWAGGGTTGWLSPESADLDRSRFIAACNRLHAEVEPGAHVAEVGITVHTADGTEVSYYAIPGSDEVSTIVHAADHDGCVEITTEDR